MGGGPFTLAMYDGKPKWPLTTVTGLGTGLGPCSLGGTKVSPRLATVSATAVLGTTLITASSALTTLPRLRLRRKRHLLFPIIEMPSLTRQHQPEARRPAWYCRFHAQSARGTTHQVLPSAIPFSSRVRQPGGPQHSDASCGSAVVTGWRTAERPSSAGSLVS